MNREFKYAFPGFTHYNHANHSWGSIDRRNIDEVTPLIFNEEYVKLRRPVILTGFGSRAPASNGLLKWDMARLSEECGGWSFDLKNHYYYAVNALHNMFALKHHTISPPLQTKKGGKSSCLPPRSLLYYIIIIIIIIIITVAVFVVMVTGHEHEARQPAGVPAAREPPG
jgi:hypothetical protein